MNETRIKDKTNVEELEPWNKAGVDDGTINELLRKKYLGADNSIFIFQLLGLLTSIAATFITLMDGEDILLIIVAVVVAMTFLYCILENQKDRKIRKTCIQNKEYEVCDVDAYDFINTVNKKYCYVKDKNGTVFMDQNGKEDWKPKKVMYYAYFSAKNYSAKLLRMRYSRNSMLYVVFPIDYLKGMLQ